MPVLSKCVKVTNSREEEGLMKIEGSVGSGTISC